MPAIPRVLSIVPLLAVALAPPGSGASAQARLTIGDAARLAASQAAAPSAARERAEQASARDAQRRAELLPRATLSAVDGERTFNSAALGISVADPQTGRTLFDPAGQRLGPVRTWDLRLAVRQPLLDMGALANRRASHAAADAARAAAMATADDAAARAALAYVSALRADAMLAARISDSTLATQLVQLARAQVAAGTGVGLDVTRASARLAAASAQLVAARAERERARIALARALALPPAAPIELADSLDSAAGEAATAETVSRADVTAVRLNVRAAERALGAARADYLPTLAIVADHGATGKSTDRLLPTYTWSIQASVAAFDGFRRANRAAEQRAAVREAEIIRRDIEAAADADLAIAAVEMRAATALVAATAERLALADREVAEARARFEAGVAGNADLVAAAMSRNAALTEWNDARAAAVAARVGLARAQGRVTALP